MLTDSGGGGVMMMMMMMMECVRCLIASLVIVPAWCHRSYPTHLQAYGPAVENVLASIIRWRAQPTMLAYIKQELAKLSATGRPLNRYSLAHSLTQQLTDWMDGITVSPESAI